MFALTNIYHNWAHAASKDVSLGVPIWKIVVPGNSQQFGCMGLIIEKYREDFVFEVSFCSLVWLSQILLFIYKIYYTDDWLIYII